MNKLDNKYKSKLMELQYWIWIAVGLSFGLYIGIAIWSRASSTKEFYVAVEIII
ncbi:MAG: hypothetical protein O3C41_00535 [Bacteroidetes bacterium]|nr:hypothetical protein [Bacteroidota bacterium]MDA1175543.1 hypothetical protein [Bacteroidota bacterium]